MTPAIRVCDDREEERRGAAPVWLGGTDPLRRLAHWLIAAPDAGLARFGLGAAAAIHLAWLAAAVAGTAPGLSRNEGRFAPSSAARPEANDGAAHSVITGFQGILAPDFVEAEPLLGPYAESASKAAASREAVDARSVVARPAEAPNGAARGAAAGEAAGGAGAAAAPGAAGTDVAARARASLASAAAAARPTQIAGSSTGSGVFGMVRGSANADALSAPSTLRDAPNALSTRLRQDATIGRRGVALSPAASRGALAQLRFAQNRSAAARLSGGPETAYQTASAAFEDQSVRGGGVPALGAGASAGPPVGPPVAPAEGGPVSAPPVTCPSGYQLQGSQCQPMQTQNVTPYQGMVNMARTLLILGAILIAIGLFLLMKKSSPTPGGAGAPAAGGGCPGGAPCPPGTPMAQILGGLLVGAGLALIVMALVLGNQVQQQYGQTPQQQAITQGANNASQGNIGQPR